MAARERCVHNDTSKEPRQITMSEKIQSER